MANKIKTVVHVQAGLKRKWAEWLIGENSAGLKKEIMGHWGKKLSCGLNCVFDVDVELDGIPSAGTIISFGETRVEVVQVVLGNSEFFSMWIETERLKLSPQKYLALLEDMEELGADPHCENTAPSKEFVAALTELASAGKKVQDVIYSAYKNYK